MTQNDLEEQNGLPQEQAEALIALLNHVQQVLKENFEEYEVGGQIGQHPMFGPLFVLSLNQNGNTYECGFFVNELVHNFQTKEDPGLWLSSFFVDLLRSEGSKPLPQSPQSEEEAKALMDGFIVPFCAQSVRSEYEETVYVDLELHPEQGPILEAGFPSIKTGNNTCGLPLPYLLTLYLLNRDPSEPIVQALDRIKEEHENDQTVQA